MILKIFNDEHRSGIDQSKRMSIQTEWRFSCRPFWTSHQSSSPSAFPDFLPVLSTHHILWYISSTPLSVTDTVKLFFLFFLKSVSEGHRQMFLPWHMWTEQIAYHTSYVRKLKLRKVRCGIQSAACMWSKPIWSSKSRKANNSSSSPLYTKPLSKGRNCPYLCLEPELNTHEIH